MKVTSRDYKSFNTLENQIKAGLGLMSMGMTPEIAGSTIEASTDREVYECLVEFGHIDDPVIKRTSVFSKMKAIQMYKSGCTLQQIAVALGFNGTSVVGRWIKNSGAKRKYEKGICPTCGKEFDKVCSNKTYCCYECEKVANKATYRTRKRIAKRRSECGKVVDRGISVQALYKKENGICYLCGQPVDMNDYKMIRGNKVCGGRYPSIEHVIPLSKGGEHSWENVRLAHRACNTKKGAKVDGQEKVESQDKESHGRSTDIPPSV